MKTINYMTYGNIKVGKMWTFNKLAGNEEINGCMGTCGKHCKGCWLTGNWKKSPCYVVNSYMRFPKNTIPSHIRNTEMMRNHRKELFEAINLQIERARIKRPIRIHASGEIESAKELISWFEIAQKHPDIPIYVYTKAYDILNKVLVKHEIPSNFWINISIWHKNGIECYKKWRHLNNIKAFVYDDGYDYQQHNLNVSIHCPAYDTKGKMHHEITCDGCKWCFEERYKIIGCHDH